VNKQKVWGVYLLISSIWLMVILLKNGFWYMPNIYNQYLISQYLSANPTTAPNPDYLYGNYLEPLLYGLFGGKSFWGYMIYTFAISLLFIITFIIWLGLYHRDSILKKPYRVVALLIFSIFFIPFYWIGIDGMTLLLLLLSMIGLYSRWGLFFAFLLGIQHAGQGVVSFSILEVSIAFMFFVNREYRLKRDLIRVGYMIVAVAIGKAVLILWFSISDIHIVMSRSRILREYLSTHISYWLNSFVVILYSIFGVGWILVIRYIRYLYPLLISTVLTMIFIMSVADESRVGAILLLPSLFYWLYMRREVISTITLKFSIAVGLLYSVTPTIFVWEATTYYSTRVYIPTISKLIYRGGKLDIMKPFNKNGKWHFAPIEVKR